MNTKRIITSSQAPAEARTFSGGTPQSSAEREGSRSSPEPTKLATSVRRPTESHWESLIDLATD